MNSHDSLTKIRSPHLRITSKLQTILQEARAQQLPQSVLSAISEAVELCDLAPAIAEAEAKGKQMYLA